MHFSVCENRGPNFHLPLQRKQCNNRRCTSASFEALRRRIQVSSQSSTHTQEQAATYRTLKAKQHPTAVVFCIDLVMQKTTTNKHRMLRMPFGMPTPEIAHAPSLARHLSTLLDHLSAPARCRPKTGSRIHHLEFRMIGHTHISNICKY